MGEDSMKHRLVVGDPEQGALDELANEMPALAVVDPPWSRGAHGASRKRLGLAPPVDYDDLLRRIIDACALAPAALILIGNLQYEKVWNLGIDAGMKTRGSWSAPPTHLLCFGGDAWPHWSGGSDRDAVRLVIEEMTDPGDTVLCPWTCHTWLPKMCVQTGRRFAGLEIDDGRAKKILEVLNADRQ